MGQPEERRWDWGALRTPAGRLMAAETVEGGYGGGGAIGGPDRGR